MTPQQPITATYSLYRCSENCCNATGRIGFAWRGLTAPRIAHAQTARPPNVMSNAHPLLAPNLSEKGVTDWTWRAPTLWPGTRSMRFFGTPAGAGVGGGTRDSVVANEGAGRPISTADQ